MKKYFTGLTEFLAVSPPGRKYLGLSLLSLLFSLVFFLLHYRNIYYGNNFSWIFWISSLVFMVLSYLPFNFSFLKISGSIKKRDLYLLLFITAVFLITHLWNFKIAPWNQNGLFDDAAWDIYFAKNHVFSGIPLQAAYFDEVGYISREVVFHFYITLFFKIFGYNLLVFNASLLVLGFITVLFTTLIADRIFKNSYVTLITFFLINFFPLHYTHIFMGHRYAIAAPLMTVSLYFLYTGFMRKSYLRTFVSAVFAAACWDSAIMGKQYLLALFLSLIMTVITEYKLLKVRENKSLFAVFMLSFVISSLPMIFYILFNYKEYNLREQNLIGNFIDAYRMKGLSGLQPNLNELRELFFAKVTFSRQFLPDFPIIPLAYYFLLIPGFFLAFMKKRFEIIFISLIPVAASFVSGSYDFRVLLSVPALVLAISYTINFVYKTGNFKAKYLNRIFKLAVLTVLSAGLLPSTEYLWKVSRDTDHLYLLPHKDVGVSRFVQDLVAGSENPSPALKRNELNKTSELGKVPYQTLFCPYSSYAIAHLYLQNFDDRKVLSLCNQGIQLLKSRGEIFSDNIKAINAYRVTDKDLLLIWEVSDKSEEIINFFRQYAGFGTEQYYSDTIDGQPFSLYALRISINNIPAFSENVNKESVNLFNLNGQ